MSAFSQSCTTCNTRLKVRDTAVVGQIIACPKCGGMVLIKPPDQPVASGNGAKPAASDTGETRPDLSGQLRPPAVGAASFPIDTHAFDDVDALLGNVPARNMVPVPTARPTSGPGSTSKPAARPEPPMGTPPTILRSPAARQDPDSQAQTVSQSTIPVADAPPTSSPAGARLVPTATPKPSEPSLREKVAAAAAIPPLPAHPADKHPSATPAAPWTAGGAPAEGIAEPPVAPTIANSPWQYWVVVSASGALGVILAIGVVGYSISLFGRTSASQPIARAPAAAEQIESSPADPAAAKAVPGEVDLPVEAKPAETRPGEPKAVEPTNEVPPIAEVKPSSTELPPPVPGEPKPAAADPAAETDPLGLTKTPANTPPKPNDLASLDDPLKKFDNLIGGGIENPLPQATAPEPKPAAPQLEGEPELAPSTDLLPRPEARQVDASARLSDPLPAIEISGTPLADFLQVMQDLSTVPMTLRPDGLAMVKLTPLSPETPVSWKGEATTVADALRGALRPLGLEVKVEADQLVVDVASPQLTSMRLAVKDLTASDEQRAAELAALVMALVAPESWTEEEGQPALTPTKDELQIRQHRLALAESVLMVEKLRVARGLRPASKFDPRLFELMPRTERAQAALATPVTLNYSQPTPLLRIVERLGKTANLRILIDWQSLGTVGWNPAAEATLSVEKQPLSAALDDLTRRMQLAWRVVDARTIQILTPAALAAHAELEFHRVGDLANNDQSGNDLVAKLRSALGNQQFRDAGGRGELRYDAPGKCLIALLPQPQQRQLAALLTQLRANSAARN